MSFWKKIKGEDVSDDLNDIKDRLIETKKDIKTIKQDGYKLDVHHVNFDKQSCCNDTIPLFVSLCRSCHMKTSFNRDYWQDHFTEMINEQYNGRCYLQKDGDKYDEAP